jgi:hypothetical protein
LKILALNCRGSTRKFHTVEQAGDDAVHGEGDSLLETIEHAAKMY